MAETVHQETTPTPAGQQPERTFTQAEMNAIIADRLNRERGKFADYDELKAKGQEASFEDILHNVEERDRIDQTREVSPLRKADDAILLDNSNMTIAEQKEWLMNQYLQATHA